MDAARGGEQEPADCQPLGPPSSPPLLPQRLAAVLVRWWQQWRWRVRALVCVHARSHCSISASRCAPPSSRLCSLAGSSPQPTRSGALEMASFCPPPTPFPSPPSRLYLICCHLRTRERARAPVSSIMHGQLSSWALSGLPAPPPPSPPSPELKGLQRGGVGYIGKRKWLLLFKPCRLLEPNPAFLQKSPIRGRDTN